MFVGRTSRTEILVSAVFGKPILTWTGLHDRFFESIYSQLGDIIPIRPDDFSIVNAFSLGDVKVTFRMFGGASSITLMADRVDFLFPSISSSDWQLVLQIIERGHKAVQMVSDAISFRQVRFVIQQHIELIEDGKPEDFMTRYVASDVKEIFSHSYTGLYDTGLKFRFVDGAQQWHVDVLVERSQLISNGIFVRCDAWIDDASSVNSFADQHALLEGIYLRTLAAVGLELRNEPVSAT
jgi:hypothetical protein